MLAMVTKADDRDYFDNMEAIDGADGDSGGIWNNESDTMVAAMFMTMADVGGGGGRNEARVVQAAILVLEGDVNGGGVAKCWQ